MNIIGQLKIKVELNQYKGKFLLNVSDQTKVSVVTKLSRELYKKEGGLFLVSGLTKTEKFREQIEKRKKE